MTTEPRSANGDLRSDDLREPSAADSANEFPVFQDERTRPITELPGYEVTERGPVIFGPEDGPLEGKAERRVDGPLYVGADEVMPELEPAPAEAGEARKAFDLNLDRRSLLKFFGAGAAAATATGCLRRPVEKIIPYVNQPVDQLPGVPTYYATTCGECSAGCGVVVRTREGRPTKIEGNPEHPISQGGVCSMGQATLQGLYHPERRKQPLAKVGNRQVDASWDDVKEALGSKLAGKKVAIFTGGSTGSRHQFYRDWLKAIGSTEERLYTFEPNALYSTIAAAHKLAYGVEAMPRPDIRQAKLVVGIGSDFLDVGTSPVFMAKSFTAMRTFKNGSMGKIVQFESMLTQTGGRADYRHVIRPGTELLSTMLLVKSLAAQTGAKGSASARAAITKVLEANATALNAGYETVGVPQNVFDSVAAELLAGPSIVMCGGTQSFDQNATQLQLAAIMANELCGAYGSTLFLDKGWMPAPVKVGDLKRFMTDVSAEGGLDAVIFIDTNPAFTVPKSFGLAAAVAKVPVVVSMQSFPNETDLLAGFVLNTHHYLESWGDEQPVVGFWSARQPAIRPTTDSRQAEDVLLWLAAHMKKPMPFSEYRDYLKDRWKAVHAAVDQSVEYNLFFDAVLRRGFVSKLKTQAAPSFADVSASFSLGAAVTGSGTMVLTSPLDHRLHDGRGANKPVLQEVGDAMTRIAWDTWIGINPKKVRDLGFKRNDVLLVESSAGSFRAALYPMPGLHADAVVVHRGNGHDDVTGKISGSNGVDPLVAFARAEDPLTGMPVTAGEVVKLSSTGAVFQLAAYQKHNDIDNRKDIVQKVTVAQAASEEGKTWNMDDVPDLYPALYKDVENRWGMSVDLTKCTGCGACMVACAQENNVSMVGREQILLGREMHWIRLDRYFAGDVDNPQVTVQPMMCQQCSHAPCEAVCPVYATQHDPEGINSMTYNRCIGTRYCANACPYKVRRFNWWTHKWNVIGDRLVDRNPRALNPDVTVRTRGVMEKCNFCFQRVREAKHRAKEMGTKVQDGAVKVACEQTCPTDAIVFGNLLDPASRVTALRKSVNSYMALNGIPGVHPYGIKTLPNVTYVKQISFAEPAGKKKTDAHHG